MRDSLTWYKSLVLPLLDYGDVIYMCATEDKLQLIQNCACRIILGAGRRLNLMRPSVRGNLHRNCQCHKNVYNEVKTGFDMFFC